MGQKYYYLLLITRIVPIKNYRIISIQIVYCNGCLPPTLNLVPSCVTDNKESIIRTLIVDMRDGHT